MGKSKEMWNVHTRKFWMYLTWLTFVWTILIYLLFFFYYYFTFNRSTWLCLYATGLHITLHSRRIVMSFQFWRHRTPHIKHSRGIHLKAVSLMMVCCSCFAHKIYNFFLFLKIKEKKLSSIVEHNFESC